MSMEIKLTDIRGEPPLKVGEFILDKDNNVLYVGSGNFELTRNGGAEIGVIAKFIPIPPNKGIINMQDNSNINAIVSCKFIPFEHHNATIQMQDNSNINAIVSCKFIPLEHHSATIQMQDNSNINMKGSANIVT